jgi:hypothetical protein
MDVNVTIAPEMGLPLLAMTDPVNITLSCGSGVEVGPVIAAMELLYESIRVPLS